MSKKQQADYARSVDAAAQGLTGVENLKIKNKKGDSSNVNDITVDDRHLDSNGSSGANPKKGNRPTTDVTKSDRTLNSSQTAAEAAANVPNSSQGAEGGASAREMDRVAEAREKSGLWTQSQQKTLEWGIKQYPKDTPQRWEKISEHITDKSKVF